LQLQSPAEHVRSRAERVRQQYELCVYGYVVMPEHVHLLGKRTRARHAGTGYAVAETGSCAKAGSASCGFLLAGPLLRFQCLERLKFVQRLRYIHRNPVERGLVARPEDWAWSSFRHYVSGDSGPVEIESQWTARRGSNAESFYSADTAACGYPQKIPAQAELGRGTLAPSRVDLPPINWPY
jgi:putative transposase